MRAAKCKGCQATIIWVETAAGKAQPLDAKPEKRVIINQFGKAQSVNTYMPHHATCPAVDMFREGGDRE